jgi:HD-like signal output (HDOD) protein
MIAAMIPAVLFVDDDENVLRGLRRMLRSQRDTWEMVFVDSAAAALREMAQRSFDVVVTDMRMPGMDGAELLGIVRKHYPATVRIIFSGYAENESILRTVGPAHKYLTKPCDHEVLIDSISQTIALRKFMANDRMREFVSSLRTLPSPPEIMIELLQELRSEISTTNSIAAILGRDVAMTVETMKLVNSSFFFLPSRVTGLAQAVRLLGVDTIRALALIAGIYSQFSGDERTANIIRRLGQRSLGIGAIAKEIAEMENMSCQEIQEALCAGVLSHVGVLVLIANFPRNFDKAMDMVENGLESVFDAERNVFGASHAELGAYLLGLWGFVDTIVETVAFHHEPSDNLANRNRIIGIVHCAQAFAKRSGNKASAIDIKATLDTKFLEATNQLSRVPDWEQAAVTILERGEN